MTNDKKEILLLTIFEGHLCLNFQIISKCSEIKYKLDFGQFPKSNSVY